MFYIKEDDMDGLFRKAAEDYQLNADKAADWNSVYNALQEDKSVSPDNNDKKKKRKRRFVFWPFLLAMLLVSVSYFWIQSDYSENSPKEVAATQKWQKTDQKEMPELTATAQKNPGDNKTETAVDANAHIGLSSNRSRSIEWKNVVEVETAKNVGIETSTREILSENKPGKPDMRMQPDSGSNYHDETNERISDLLPSDSLTKERSSVEVVKIKSSDSIPRVDPPVKRNERRLRESFFYGGVVAAPDLSFVKFQKTSDPGFSLGITAGYRINRNFSVETGLLFDKKKYYTAGKYFDKSTVAYLQNSDLLTVDGYCNMLEIPLNFRYHFPPKKDHSFFVGAGTSSYLMKKENYDYKYIYDGELEESSHAYESSSKHWFSMLNLSAGYELQLGSKAFLRVEPYYKTPLGKVGRGRLPLSSTGINFSLSRRIP